VHFRIGCALLLGALVRLDAQDAGGSIAGKITDPLDAAIPNARIELVHSGTNVSTAVETNESGIFVAPFLPVGVYRLTASREGFQRVVRDNIELRVSDRLQVDFRLQLGNVAEQITVSASTGVLETADASTGQVIDSATIADMPLMSQNPYTLVSLAPGIQTNDLRPGISDYPYSLGASNISVNGGRAFSNGFLLDGIPNTGTEATEAAGVAFVPSPAATAEFKVQTSTYDAQYGRTGGGVVSVSLKSGTNKPHGQFYNFWRNDILNSNRFESNLVGTPRETVRWNQPGVEIDGPVCLPRLYDGRNRTFFMVSWEGIRGTMPWVQLFTVATPDQLGGDFSKTTIASGAAVQVYDPYSTQLSGGRYVRQAFPNSRIPASRINPVSRKIVAYFPKPNNPSALTNNLIASPNSFHDAYDQNIIRIDHALSSRNRLSARWLRNNRHQIMGDAAFPHEASPGYLHQRANSGAGFDITSLLSPSTVLSSRVGYIRHVFQIIPYGDRFDLAGAGFPAQTVSQLQRQVFPRITLTDYSNVGPGRSIGAEFTHSTTDSVTEILSKSLGSHTVKIGGEFQVILNNQELPTGSFGVFGFTRVFTQRYTTLAEAASGDAVASMLLGVPASGNVPYNIANAYGNRFYGVFVHDDWRVTGRLTLNIGLRWEYESPTTERYDRQNRGFDGESISNFAIPGYQVKGGLLFTDSKRRLPYDRDLDNIQPRAGAAYRLGKDTVVRAGFGISYLPTFQNGGSLGFSSVTSYAASVDEGQTPLGRWDNPYPAGFIQPEGRSRGLSTQIGATVTYSYPNRVIPRSKQFSVEIQRQLPGRTLFAVAFVGSRASQLSVTRSVNEMTAEQYKLGAAVLNAQTRSPFAGLLPGSTLNNANVSNLQMMRPFPQFTTISELYYPSGGSWYNSLQVRSEKRFSSGFHFLANYTWSKTIEALSYRNPQDPVNEVDRVLSAMDTPHRVIFSGGYTLPFARRSKGFMKVAFQGWQFNSVIAVQRGVPVGAPTGAVNSTGLNPKLPSSVQSRQRWFNTCTLTAAGARQNCLSPDEAVAFVILPSYTLRTMSSRFPDIRTPMRLRGDASVFKTFQVNERARLQFRGEVFNAANHPVFGAPAVGINAVGFGAVTNAQVNDPRQMQLVLKLLF
jgi:hypothetical protein